MSDHERDLSEAMETFVRESELWRATIRTERPALVEPEPASGAMAATAGEPALVEAASSPAEAKTAAAADLEPTHASIPVPPPGVPPAVETEANKHFREAAVTPLIEPETRPADAHIEDAALTPPPESMPQVELRLAEPVLEDEGEEMARGAAELEAPTQVRPTETPEPVARQRAQNREPEQSEPSRAFPWMVMGITAATTAGLVVVALGIMLGFNPKPDVMALPAETLGEPAPVVEPIRTDPIAEPDPAAVVKEAVLPIVPAEQAEEAPAARPASTESAEAAPESPGEADAPKTTEASETPAVSAETTASEKSVVKAKSVSEAKSAKRKTPAKKARLRAQDALTPLDKVFGKSKRKKKTRSKRKKKTAEEEGWEDPFAQ